MLVTIASVFIYFFMCLRDVDWDRWYTGHCGRSSEIKGQQPCCLRSGRWSSRVKEQTHMVAQAVGLAVKDIHTENWRPAGGRDSARGYTGCTVLKLSTERKPVGQTSQGGQVHCWVMQMEKNLGALSRLDRPFMLKQGTCRRGGWVAVEQAATEPPSPCDLHAPSLCFFPPSLAHVMTSHFSTQVFTFIYVHTPCSLASWPGCLYMPSALVPKHLLQKHCHM